ncbi:hypothetical protein BH10ACI1_BH10ACI1_15380 [soil metagenome]
MNLEELKSNWKQTGAEQKSQAELLMMTKIQNHPILNRIRLKLIIESILLIIFLIVYHNMFDGGNKPLWANITLVISAALYILTDFIGYLILQNPVSGNNLKNSINNLHLKLKRITFFSMLTSFLFGSSVILFFAPTIDFTKGKYLMLAGMIVTLIILMYLSYKNWMFRINRIKTAKAEFDETVS